VPDLIRALEIVGLEVEVPLQEGILKTPKWFRKEGI
jgi:hypothetical protein